MPLTRRHAGVTAHAASSEPHGSASVDASVHMLSLKRVVQVKGEFFALVLLRRFFFFLLERAPKCTFEAFLFALCPFRLNQPQTPSLQSFPLISIYISKGGNLECQKESVSSPAGPMSRSK